LVDAGDAELTAALCAQSPVSKRALEDADFARRYLPAFRADLARIAGYCYREGAPLRANLLLLDGRDELCLDDAQRAAWAREVAGSVQFDALPGDHFFVQTHEPQVLARIRESIDDSAIEARSTATHVFALTSHLHGETTS
jgi:medium-chain acyl-[acyl-carrier-protein] hydrolase